MVLLTQFCNVADRSIPSLRTGLLVVGLIAAALRAGELADFLFVTGLLLQFAIWFESWWSAPRAR